MEFTWLDKTEYPFAPKYFPVNNQRMHYIDEGSGDTLLFVHGTPSWSFEYRNIIKRLSSSFRCVAIDHIGFGLSDKPEKYDYSISNHCRALSDFIISKDLTDITLVVHDFGGPIGLNFAIEHPERIRKFVILNTWMWSPESDPDFKKMKKLFSSPLLPFLYRYFNFSARVLLPKSFGEKKIGKKTRLHYVHPFAHSKQREGTVAFARSLLKDQSWFESLWERREAVAHKPTLFVWGMKDSFIKPKYLDKFMSAFTDHIALKLPTCGHFPQEEEPAVVSAEIEKFMRADRWQQIA